MTLTATVMNADGTTRQVEYPPAREPEMLNCGHMSTPTQIWPGYARIEGGYLICANCAADIDREEAKAGRRVFAYVGPDGIHVNRGRRVAIVTWAGVEIGSAIASRVTYDSRNNKIRYVQAVVAGVRMYGRHYPDAGDYIRLRPNKRQD